MTKKYLALTIGPIYRTLVATRSTKAMWSASYLFSYIMRDTIRLVQKALNDTEGVQFLSPYIGNGKILDHRYGVGLFHDRFVVALKEGQTVPDMKTFAQKVVETLSKDIIKDSLAKEKKKWDTRNPALKKEKQIDTSRFNYTQKEIQDFLNQYLQLYALTIETDSNNPVKYIDEYLNALELQQSFVPIQQRDFLYTFFEDVYFNEFIEAEFGANAGFPSTAEIATAEFSEHNDYKKARKDLRDFNWKKLETETDAAEKQREFFKEIKRIVGDKEFRLRHKYVAIVQADGDNMGSFFASLNDAQRALISEKLKDFSIEAVDNIKKYHATPVYAGGDDLLFFAPLMGFVGEEPTTIFDLIDSLDSIFDRCIIQADNYIAKQIKDLPKKPSMSYGISMGYYKYPLGESLAKAHSLLFDDIKNADDSGKNAIAWQVLKHSGHGFGTLFTKGTKSYTVFKKMLKDRLPRHESAQVFLASIIYKLEAHEGLLMGIADSIDFETHLDNLFKNNFNESIHRKSDNRQELIPFLVNAKQLLVETFKENPAKTNEQDIDKKNRIKQNMDKTYAALRFVQFLKTEDRE